MEQKDSKSTSRGPHGPDNGTNNTSATNTAAKPVPTEEFLQQVLGLRSHAGPESTPRYTATVELGAVTTPSSVDTHQSATKISTNDQISTYSPPLPYLAHCSSWSEASARHQAG